MGFKVIAFESSMYDCRELNSGILSNKTIDTNHNISWIWSRCQQVKPLFRYLIENSRTSNPLEIAGFDLSFSKERVDFSNKFIDFLKEFNFVCFDQPTQKNYCNNRTDYFRV